MKQIKKRVLSSLLSLCMIFTVVQIYGADKADALRFSGMTIYLENDDDFQAFATAVNDGTTFEKFTVVLTSDITLKSDFPMIGEYGAFSNSYFSGIFDGNGHTIKGDISSSDNFVGLFACIKNATLRNFTYIGNVFGDNYTFLQDNATAGVCAYAHSNCTLSGISHIGSVTGAGMTSTPSVGGILGIGTSGESLITDCHQSGGDITAAESFGIGGIAGTATDVRYCTNRSDLRAIEGGACQYMGGIVVSGSYYTSTPVDIRSCTNYGNIYTIDSGTLIGGIASRYCHIIEDCVNYGNLGDKGHIGGILCSKNDELAAIKNCANYGNLTTTKSNASVGGILARSFGYDDDVIIKNCINAGKIEGQCGGGGITGEIHGATFENCINTGEVTIFGSSTIAAAGGICGRILCEDDEICKIKNCVNTGIVNIYTAGGSLGLVGENAELCRFENCYQNADKPLATYKTDEAFASGEVCWLLNGQQSSNPNFYQRLGTDPVPMPNSSGIVEKSGDGSYKNKGFGFVESSPVDGKVSITADGEPVTTQNIKSGSSVTLRAIPDEGYKILEWKQQTASSAGVRVSYKVSEDKNSVSFTMPDGNVSITPIFTTVTHNVKFAVLGSNFEISSQDVIENSEIQLPDMEEFFDSFYMTAVFGGFILDGKSVTSDEIRSADFDTDTVIFADITAEDTVIYFYDENGNAYTDMKYRAQVLKELTYFNIPTPPKKEEYRTTLGWRIGENGDILTQETINQIRGKGIVKLYAAYSRKYEIMFFLSKNCFTPTLENDILYERLYTENTSFDAFPENYEVEAYLKENYGVYPVDFRWRDKFGYALDDIYNTLDPNSSVAYGEFFCDDICFNFYDADGMWLDESVGYPEYKVKSINDLILPAPPKNEYYKGYIGGWSLEEGGEFVTDEQIREIFMQFDFEGLYELYAVYKPIDFAPSDISFVDENGKAYTASTLNSGEKVKAVLTTSSSSDLFRPTLILALYDGDKLVDFTFSDKSNEDGTAVETSVLTAKGDNITVKVFVWDSLYVITPLCESVSLNSK